jgi:hypothetical protein
MDWVQALTIMATLLGGVFYLHSDIREIRKDMQQQNSRIDKLYEMFVDLLREKK